MKSRKLNPVLIIVTLVLAVVVTLARFGYSEMALGLKVKDWIDLSVNAKK